MLRPTLAVLTVLCAGLAGTSQPTSKPAIPAAKEGEPMPTSLGNFSVSLNVKDVAASKAFYEKLGFRPVFGDGKRMQIMQNDTATIGLFQGMFEKNTLTFNPGWDRSMKTLASFEDVRDIQKELVKRGLTPTLKTDEAGTGPAFITLADPDGNPIVIDQHVPKK